MSHIALGTVYTTQDSHVSIHAQSKEVSFYAAVSCVPALEDQYQ